MAAGLGFKTFATGDVLSATDVNGYLMQGILVFASATARDAAITAPAEGQFAYLKDTNVTTYYTGSAWANVDTTGMTNPMTTTGDTIYSSSGSTPARLGIGTAGQVLRVNSGATAPEWATPAGGGGMTLLSTTTLSGATTTISGISQDYVDLQVVISGVTNATADGNFGIDPNSNSGLAYTVFSRGATFNNSAAESLWLNYFNTYQPLRTSAANNWTLTLNNYAETTYYKSFSYFGGYTTSVNLYPTIGYGTIATNSAITELLFKNTGGNLSTGTVEIYGVK